MFAYLLKAKVNAALMVNGILYQKSVLTYMYVRKTEWNRTDTTMRNSFSVHVMSA